MYNKIDKPMLILTFILPLYILYLCYEAIYSSMQDGIAVQALYSALCLSVPLVVSLFVVTAVMTARSKKYVFKKVGSRPHSIVLAFVLASLLGCIGQVLYEFKPEEKKEDIVEKEEPVYMSDMDMVLLMDSSTSMLVSIDSCKEAAKRLIDGMDENDRMQIIPFASVVLDITELLQLDSSGKQTLKNFIDNIDTVGMTNFDASLDVAYQTLTSVDRDAGKAVILITDGAGSVSSNVKNEYKNDNIVVYSVSLGVDDIDSGLAKFIEDTGGENFSISKDANGDADVDEILDALKGAYTKAGGGTSDPGEEEAEEHKIDTLLFGSNINVYKFFVRFVVFALYGILASYTIYLTFSFKNILYGLFSGILAAGAITAFGDYDMIIFDAIVLDILYCCAVTRYYDASESSREAYYV